MSTNIFWNTRSFFLCTFFVLTWLKICKYTVKWSINKHGNAHTFIYGQPFRCRFGVRCRFRVTGPDIEYGPLRPPCSQEGVWWPGPDASLLCLHSGMLANCQNPKLGTVPVVTGWHGILVSWIYFRKEACIDLIAPEKLWLPIEAFVTALLFQPSST